jgi:isoprenylcysteine carboxyl methyltransferase (ICMT) family protein YpbQ
MSSIKDYVNTFKTISYIPKIFLLFFLVIAVLPIHKVTGSNIQSIIGDGIYHYGNYNKFTFALVHSLVALLFVLSYLTNDGILFGLLLFFNFHDTNRNKDKKDRDKWYI